MGSRETLLNQLNETISQTLDIFKNMADPEITVYENWSAKDVLGHITFWHESFARNVNDIAGGKQPTPLKGRYSDLTQQCLSETRTQTVDTLAKRLATAHNLIQKNILNTAIILIPYKKGSRDYSPEEHLDIVNEHIKEHLNDIKGSLRPAMREAGVAAEQVEKKS